MEWIKVETRLPTKTGPVLVFASNTLSSWMEIVCANPLWQGDYVWGDYPPIITHWAELPEQPEDNL